MFKAHPLVFKFSVHISMTYFKKDDFKRAGWCVIPCPGFRTSHFIITFTLRSITLLIFHLIPLLKCKLNTFEANNQTVMISLCVLIDMVQTFHQCIDPMNIGYKPQ